jgi:hypothetical protein
MGKTHESIWGKSICIKFSLEFCQHFLYIMTYEVSEIVLVHYYQLWLRHFYYDFFNGYGQHYVFWYFSFSYDFDVRVERFEKYHVTSNKPKKSTKHTITSNRTKK